jgi:hypothetical protein
VEICKKSMHTLKEAVSNRNGTRQMLLAVMKNDHASDKSLLFAASFSSEAAYLAAIAPIYTLMALLLVI